MNDIERSTLLIQKRIQNAPVVNLYKQWNIACTKIPFPKYESKEISVHESASKSGEDAYIPSYIPHKAYDITIEFTYKGDFGHCYTDISGFLKYLQGNPPVNDDYDSITEGGFNIYERYNGIGRQKVYMKSFDPEDLAQMTDADYINFKIIFRVTDPDTDISLIDPNAKVVL